MNEDPRGTAAITLPTVTAVADPTAGRTHPIRVQQCRSHILAIAIAQAWPTELSSHPATALVPTHCLGIDGLLPTLMAGVTQNFIIDFISNSYRNIFQVLFCNILHWSE